MTKKTRTKTLVVSCSCAGVQESLVYFVDKRPMLRWGSVDMIAIPGAITTLAHPSEIANQFFALLQNIRIHIEAPTKIEGLRPTTKLILVDHPRCKFRKLLRPDDFDFCQTDELNLALENLSRHAKTQDFNGNGWDAKDQPWIQGLEILLFYGRQTDNGLVFRKVPTGKQACCHTC